jgi:fatty-acyl-CoA synthase
LSEDNPDTRTDSSRNSPLKAWLRALNMVAPITTQPEVILPRLIDTLADKFEAATALVSERESLSYRVLAERTHRYSRWALANGLTNGAVACLLMQNCAEYLAIWLGITRVGGVVSLLNTNLIGGSLAHATGAVAPRHVIVGADLADVAAGVLSRLAPQIRVWSHGENGHSFPRLDLEIEQTDGSVLPDGDYAAPSIRDRALCIYTSGTTGLPKAANVSHFRLMQWCNWFAGMMNTCTDDRMYNCLPMYHSVGGIVAIGATLVNGGSVVLRERFSASRFWDDIVESKCTLFQYIGELCRYLVNTPAHPLETRHRLRLACGNGLRPDVWEEFKWRFRIPQILEFYASTEGNFSLYNCEGRVGAIGKIPSLLARQSPIALVRFDHDTGEPERGADGFCIRCAANETGEAIGKIASDRSDAVRESRFEGYTDEAASDKKILRNVFANGDAWFRSGDLMRRDQDGFFYFVDRVGDTFRWKGENVSTTEVAEAITAFPGAAEAVVYGVTIPGTEGRAGMAAAVVGSEFDLAAFRQHLAQRLPEYARPVFLRMLGRIEATPTFKMKKNDLSQQAFDPAGTSDAIYFNHPGRDAFVRLDSELYDQIKSGKIRL